MRSGNLLTLGYLDGGNEVSMMFHTGPFFTAAAPFTRPSLPYS
jgi:hypothetical protein